MPYTHSQQALSHHFGIYPYLFDSAAFSRHSIFFACRTFRRRHLSYSEMLNAFVVYSQIENCKETMEVYLYFSTKYPHESNRFFYSYFLIYPELC